MCVLSRHQMNNTTTLITSGNITESDSPGDGQCYSVETRQTHALDIVSPIVEAVLMIMICSGNGAVFLVFWRRKALHLWSLAHYFILQLSIADFTVGLAMPFHVSLYFQRRILYSPTICVLRYASLMLSGSASVTALLAMSYDRYLAIVRPMKHYNSSLSWKRGLFTGLFIWVPPVILAFILPVVWHNQWPIDCPMDCDMVLVLKKEYFLYVMFPAIPLVAVAMVFLYARVLVVARGHVRRLRVEEAKTSTSRAKEKQRRRDLNVFKTCLIVITVFCVCWLPYCVITAMQILGDMLESSQLQASRSVAVFFAVFNSAMNPIIYAFRLPGFRRDLVNIVTRDRRRMSVISMDSSGLEPRRPITPAII